MKYALYTSDRSTEVTTDLCLPNTVQNTRLRLMSKITVYGGYIYINKRYVCKNVHENIEISRVQYWENPSSGECFVIPLANDDRVEVDELTGSIFDMGHGLWSFVGGLCEVTYTACK